MKFKLVLLSVVLLTFFNVEAQSTNQKKGFNTPTHQINPAATTPVEVPVIFTDRTEGMSKMSGGIFFEAVIGVMQMKLKSFFRNWKR